MAGNALRKDPNVVEFAPVGWRVVQAERFWQPKVGDSLEGQFLGKKVKRNRHNEPYEVVIVRSEEETFAVSGTVILSLFDNSGALPHDEVRIVYKGTKPCNNSEYSYKDFNLYVRAPLTGGHR